MTVRNDVIIRRVIENDLGQIKCLFNHYIKTSIYTMDLDEKSDQDIKNWHISHQGRYPAYVALLNNEIIGIASLSKWAERRGYYPSCEASIYLSPSYSAQGHGDTLLEHLISAAKKNDFSSIISFMTSINKLARNLVRRNQFIYIGTMKNVAYKFDRPIDMDLYQYIIKTPDKNEASL